MKRTLAVVVVADMASYSRLMERDAQRVFERQKAHRREVIEPKVSERGGRIVKATGDGFFATFHSVHDAVDGAMAIQRALVAREAQTSVDARMLYRMGINMGDVIEDEGDVFGDAVNVAARLQAIAEPGGVCVSDVVHQSTPEAVRGAFRNLGQQRVKNIARPIKVWQWTLDGGPSTEAEPSEPHVEMRFATASDDVSLAWASVGEGRPVLRAQHWFNHLDYEWRSPVFRPFLHRLAEGARLVRFDQRGTGLSDWEPATISIEAMVDDIGTVADAAQLDRFALVGMSQGCAYSLHYAVAHPERVSCLVLLGGYARGRLQRPSEEQRQLYAALTTAIRDGWGSPNPAFRSFFTASFLGEAGADAVASFDELQRMAASPASAMRIWQMNAQINVCDLARHVSTPTLVLHCRGDRVAPLEEGRLLARLIPGARLVELAGNNHILQPRTEAFEMFFEEVEAFVDRHVG